MKTLGLETEVSESTVGLSHLVHVLLALVSTALVIECVYDFGSQLLSHCLAAALAGVEDKVFHRDRFLAVGTNLGRHLESGTADTTRLNLNLGCNVLKSFLPDFESGLLFVGHLGLNGLKCGVEDSVGGVLLAVVHQMVHKLRYFHVMKDGIGQYEAFLRLCFSHCLV